MPQANDTSDDSDAQIPATIENYRDLFQAFLNGARGGSHRKVEIRAIGDRTLLVAYNKWVYATREMQSGHITVYNGWTDKENATTASNIQFGYLMQEVDALNAFRRTVMVDEDDRLLDLEGNEYDSFTVEAPLA